MNERLAPIVVGVDRSASSIDALRWACGVAANRQRPVLAVTAEPSEAEAHAVSRHAVLHAFHGAPPRNLTVITRVAEPADALTECSRDAYLLVVGSREHGGIPLDVRVSCPVLTMHHTHAADPTASVPQTASRTP